MTCVTGAAVRARKSASSPAACTGDTNGSTRTIAPSPKNATAFAPKLVASVSPPCVKTETASERRFSARPISDSVRHEGLRSRRERLLDELDDTVRRDLGSLPLAARGDLDDAALKALAAHDDAHGKADKVEVLELHAGALVAIVVENLDSRGLEALVEPVRRLEDMGVTLEHGDDAGERRERHRPDDSDVVVILLDGRRHRAAEAEPVAAHRERHHLLGLVGDLAFHRLGVLRPELEDVADLDAAPDSQRALARGRGIALARGRDLDDAFEVRQRQHVARNAHAGMVKALEICPAPEVRTVFEGTVDEEGNRIFLEWKKTERPDEPGPRACHFPKNLLRSQLHMERANRLRELDNVDGEIAANQDGREPRLAVRSHRLVDHRVDDALRSRPEVLGLSLGRRNPRRRRVRLAEGPRLLTRPGLWERGRNRLLDVRAVVARVREDERVLARVGHDHEFLRRRAADGARVGFHERVLEIAALEDAPVRSVHLPVMHVEALLVHVERVRVLHEEFAAAQEAEARADLVAKLRADLVKIERELPPGRDGAPHHVGDGLLGRRRERELAALTVLEAKEYPVVYIALPAARFHPELFRLQDRQVDFHRARGIHLLAHDVDHFPQRPEAEGRERVDARGELVDESRAVEELMRDDLGVAGHLAEGDEKRLGPAHRSRRLAGGAVLPARGAPRPPSPKGVIGFSPAIEMTGKETS